MKMKEIGFRWGGCTSLVPPTLGSANDYELLSGTNARGLPLNVSTWGAHNGFRTYYGQFNRKTQNKISYGILCNVASPLSVTCGQPLTSNIINVILISFSLSKHQSSKYGHSLTLRYLMWPKSATIKQHPNETTLPNGSVQYRN